MGGVNLTDSCSFCEPGTYSAFDGSPTCTLCASGSYTNKTGATSCDFCPKGAFLTFEGGVSVANCTMCSSGFSTVTSGSVSEDACIVPFSCPFGSEKKILVPTSTADCIPLSCKEYPFLGREILGAGCTGCATGSSGIIGSSVGCIACPSDSICPGFLPIPLSLDTYSSLSSGIAAAAIALTPGMKRLCIAAADSSHELFQLTDPPIDLFSSEGLQSSTNGTKVSLGTAGGLSGIILLLAVFFIFYLYRRSHLERSRVIQSPTASQQSYTARVVIMIARAIKSSDGFAFEHAPVENSPQVNRPTVYGGFCNVTGYIVFLIIACIYIIRFNTDNSITSSALDTVTPIKNPFTANILWASPRGSADFTPPLETSTSLQVRVFAQLALGCATPLSWSSSSNDKWKLDTTASASGSVTDCGDGRSLIIFSCIACEFSAASTLEFTLPFSCQALFVEVISVDSTGSLQNVALPKTESTATSTTMLSSISWSVSLQASFYSKSEYNNKVNPFQTVVTAAARGFRLLQGSSTAVRTNRSGTKVLLPLPSAVIVKIALPLQLTYSSTIIIPRQALTDVFATLIGLLGIMGLFKFLFTNTESCGKLACCQWYFCKRFENWLHDAKDDDDSNVIIPPTAANDVSFYEQNPLRQQENASAVLRSRVATTTTTMPHNNINIPVISEDDDVSVYEENPLRQESVTTKSSDIHKNVATVPPLIENKKVGSIYNQMSRRVLWVGKHATGTNRSDLFR